MSRFKVLFITLFFQYLISGTVGWRIFHKGRLVGGNIIAPPSTVQQSQKVTLPDLWFNQILDHFNPTDLRTWKQRYYVDDSFYNPSNGVAFIYIGGEGEVNITSTMEGQWTKDAKTYGALCFVLEHRFYGKSHPTSDMSTKNLQYLSSQQALADLANFIESMNKEYNLKDAKWIAFGGSYPGSLAAWLRYKYPHLVVGSMSASGPLLAKSNFYEYMEVVVASLRTHSDECVNAITIGNQQLEELLKTDESQHQINDLFQLCDPINDVMDNQNEVDNLFETLSDNFANVVQYNKDNRIGRFPRAHLITIDTLCDIMVNQTIGSEVQRLAAVNALLLDVYEQKCLDYRYRNMIKTLRDDTWDSQVSEGGRQWTYQTCTEFGFYQTSDSKPQVFGHRFPLNFFVQQCEDIFGPKFNLNFINNATFRTNNFYGALDLEVSNVVFVHGSIDPWHALGITETKNNNAPAIFINGTAHCANMYPSSPDDPPNLTAAREQVTQLIGSWLRLG